MSYAPATDLLALLRQTAGGMRAVRMPGLDYVLAALARAGMFQLAVGSSAPVANQATTVWLRPASPSWAFEGTVFLWNVRTLLYEVATPALWAALLAPVVVVQDIVNPGPANVAVNATVVRVNQIVPAPITLVVPAAAAAPGVLISDWKGDAGTNNITVQLSGADVFPGGLTSWKIASDAGSLFLRPVPGGYAL